MKNLISLISSLTPIDWLTLFFTFWAYFFLIKGIVKNKGFGQNFFTWFLWVILDVLTYIIMKKGDSSSKVLVLGFILGSSTTTIFLIKYKMKWTIDETMTLIITSIVVFCWIRSGSNLLGLILAVIAQIIAGLPLIKESYKEPESGYTFISYIFFVIGYILTMIKSPDWEINNILFPISLLLYTFVNIYPLVIKWWEEKNSA